MKGKLSISRCTSNEGHSINIALIDQLSGVEVLDLDISVENFGFVVTGHGYVGCEFELHAKYAGKLREHKTIEIEVDNPYRHRTPEEAAVILAPYEIDGWVGEARDLGNSHRTVRNGKAMMVLFERYVDPITREPVL